MNHSEGRRSGPHPLGFHVMLSSASWLGGAAALPAFLAGTAAIHPSLVSEADLLRERLLSKRDSALAAQVLDEARMRLEQVLRGMTAYQTHPYRRASPPAPSIFERGGLKLRDYASGEQGQNIFAVPSLINPAHILDLEEGVSFMRFLGRQGFHSRLVDWGGPEGEELDFSLEDYVLRRLEPALEAAAADGGGPQILLGYCMGGNLALALSLRRPDLVRGLVLIAMPWDFHAEGVTLSRAVATILSGSLALLPPRAPVPLDVLQIFFASLDPTLTDRKFRKFARLDPGSEAARRFVAVEDWANGGGPLARRVAEECLYQWYGLNTPGRRQWTIGGTPVDPRRLSVPALVALPSADRIVPPASAAAIIDDLPRATVLRTGQGHVAMVAGSAAEEGLWRPLAEWCASLPRP